MGIGSDGLPADSGSLEARLSELETELSLERFERQIRQGPPAARVDEVETTDLGATGHDVGFSIR